MDIDTIFTLPFKILFAVTGFVMWYVLSNGEWRQRKRWKGGCPVGFLQDQVREAYRQQREDEYKYRRHEVDLRRRYEERIKNLERELDRERRSKRK